MKLIVKTDKEVKKLRPRDIRNFIGSIVDEEYKDVVLWHKHLPPELVFVKPFKFGFEIVSWSNNTEVLNHIADKLQQKDLKLNIKDINTKIEKVWFKNEEFTIPQKGLYFYKTRTPMILAVNPVEYKIVYACNTKDNKDDLLKYIKHRIETNIKHQAKHYFNMDIDLDDLNLIIQNEDIRLVSYKEDSKKFQAAYLTFASNYSLPRFIGYSIGMGWGEIIHQKM